MKFYSKLLTSQHKRDTLKHRLSTQCGSLSIYCGLPILFAYFFGRTFYLSAYFMLDVLTVELVLALNALFVMHALLQHTSQIREKQFEPPLKRFAAFQYPRYFPFKSALLCFLRI